MLALAQPVQSHSSAHSVVVGSNIKVPSTRSKPLARRAPSSTQSSASLSIPSSSSSSSSTSSSSTITPSTSRRTSGLAPTSRQDSARAVKPDAIPLSDPSSSRTAPPPKEPIQKNPPVVESVTPSATTSTRASGSFDINTYPTQDLLKLLASLLTKIATANDALPHPASLSTSSSSDLLPDPVPSGDRDSVWRTLFTASRNALSTPTSPLTFHARNIPTISLEAYLLRILRYCPTTNEVFVSLLVYFDRMSRLSEDATGNRFAIDSYNVHRLVIAGITVASKFFSDVFYTNSRYAKVGGLPQGELNQLELQFLLLNDFHLSIPSEELQRYAEHLVASESGQAGLASTVSRSTGGIVGILPFEHVAAANTSSSEHASTTTSSSSHPLHSMGAIDAYGGTVAGDMGPQQRDDDMPRNTSTPRRRPMSPASVTAASLVSSAAYAPPPPQTPVDESFERESSCGASVYSETDTDDEPTIRPTHSCASSETQSLYSNDSESGMAAEVDEEDITDRLMRSRPTHRRWDSSSSSIDGGDSHMSTPEGH